MSSYAGESLFDSGPCALRFGTWERHVQRRGFAGIHGELALDLGRRFRPILQTGRLQAESAGALHALLDAINARADGSENVLVDNHEQSHARVILERFETTSPVHRGRAFHCDYEAQYRQLP